MNAFWIKEGIDEVVLLGVSFLLDNKTKRRGKVGICVFGLVLVVKQESSCNNSSIYQAIIAWLSFALLSQKQIYNMRFLHFHEKSKPIQIEKKNEPTLSFPGHFGEV